MRAGAATATSTAPSSRPRRRARASRSTGPSRPVRDGAPRPAAAARARGEPRQHRGAGGGAAADRRRRCGRRLRLTRRRGRNDVYAGGAADAAFGPAACRRPGSPPLAVTRVADDRMDDLATTEFEPPRGVLPWTGSVLLRERIDADTVGAWFSGHAARDVLTITKDPEDGDHVVLGEGAKFARRRPADRAILEPMFAGCRHRRPRRLRQGLRHGVERGAGRDGARDQDVGLLEAARRRAAATPGSRSSWAAAASPSRCSRCSSSSA